MRPYVQFLSLLTIFIKPLSVFTSTLSTLSFQIFPNSGGQVALSPWIKIKETTLGFMGDVCIFFFFTECAEITRTIAWLCITQKNSNLFQSCLKQKEIKKKNICMLHAHDAHVLLFLPYTVLSQSVLLGLRFIHNSVFSSPTLPLFWLEPLFSSFDYSLCSLHI